MEGVNHKDLNRKMSDITEYENNMHRYFNELPEGSFHNPGCILCPVPSVDPDPMLFQKQSMVVRKCRGCGLVYNARQPKQATLDAFYKESDAMSNWATFKDSLGEEKRQREKFGRAADWCWNLNVNKLIDFGCGNGKFLSYLKRRMPSGEYWGVEVNECARKMAQAGGHVVFDGWPTSCNVDAISYFGVLEHLTDPITSLRKATKYLKRNGYVIVCVPNVESAVVQAAESECFTYCPQHLWYYSHETLNRLYKKSGFKEVHYWTIESEILPFLRARFGRPPYDSSEDSEFSSIEIESQGEHILDNHKGYKIISIAKRDT